MAVTTTLVAGFDAFQACLTGLTSSSPGGTAARLRSVFWGQGAPTDAGLPFLAMQLLSLVSQEGKDNTTTWKATIKLRVAFDGSRHAKSHDDSLRYIAQIQNALQAWSPQPGVEGGEAIEWSITLAANPGQGATSFAESIVTLQIATARGSN